MRLPITFITVFISLSCFAQTTSQSKWIDSEVTYTDSDGNELRVVNSFPKGGGTYTDSEGNTYSYVIFWYRLTNWSEVPLELEMGFPAEPFTIFATMNSHIRLFLPAESMTDEKITMNDYGLANLEGYLDAEFHEPSRLDKTINPGEEYLFYVSILIYQARGTARAKLVMDGNNLFYQININPNSETIPCGTIAFKD